MRTRSHRRRTAALIATLASALAMSALVAAPPGATAAKDHEAGQRSATTQRALITPEGTPPRRPRARAACPFCPIIAVTAIRTLAVRAAPVAIRAATRVGSSTARRRVASGARKVKSFTKKAAKVRGARLVALFEQLPKYAQGCGRGFVDHIRDVGDLRLTAVFLACGRGIIDIYLGKSPYRPVDR